MPTVFNEKKLSGKARNNLPENKFGLPDTKGYPIHDRNHVRMAIVMFHNAKPEHREELAKNIKAQADKFSINIHSSHPIHGYLENNKDSLKENTTDGLVKYLMDAIPDRPEHNEHHMDKAGFHNYDIKSLESGNKESYETDADGYDIGFEKKIGNPKDYGEWAELGTITNLKENTNSISKTIEDSFKFKAKAAVNNKTHEFVNIDYDRAIFMGKGEDLVEYHKKKLSLAKSPEEKAKVKRDIEKLISALERNGAISAAGKGAVVPLIIYPMYSIVLAAGAVALVFGAAVVAAGSALTLAATPFMSAKGIYDSFNANQARKQHIYNLKKLIK